MAPSTDLSENAALIETAASTLVLLRRFSTALIDSSNPPIARGKELPDPLNLLHDAAKLLKAHTTKLSLLILNKPYTPVAIRKVITEIASTCLPGMMSVVEICQPTGYTVIFHGEVKFRVRKVMRELEDMMEEVTAKAKEMGGASAADSKTSNSKDSLASTGVLWEACDSLMELKTLGIAGVVVKKAQEYRAMLEDAITELREWGVEEDEDEGFQDGDDEDSDDANSIEKMLSGSDHLPRGRDDLRMTLNISMKKLKLVSTLYQALIKRRLKTILSEGMTADCTTPDGNATRIDRVMIILKDIPDQTDELASAFYDLDNEESRRVMKMVCEKGKEVTGLARSNWCGDEDEFSSWSDKWIEAVDLE